MMRIRGDRMIIGLTGGSGTGKTEVARIFSQNSYEVIDYDLVTHEVYTPGSDCLAKIRERFGGEVFLSDGSLDRRALGAIVFADKGALCSLNSIVYKYILAYTADIIENSKGKKLLLDAPTLFEAGLDKKCDIIIGVIAPKGQRQKRIIERDGIDAQTAQNRINSQKTDEFYKENCDYIIENSADLETLRTKVMTVLRSIDNETGVPQKE